MGSGDATNRNSCVTTRRFAPFPLLFVSLPFSLRFFSFSLVPLTVFPERTPGTERRDEVLDWETVERLCQGHGLWVPSGNVVN